MIGSEGDLYFNVCVLWYTDLKMKNQQKSLYIFFEIQSTLIRILWDKINIISRLETLENGLYGKLKWVLESLFLS